jgi:AAA domain
MHSSSAVSSAVSTEMHRISSRYWSRRLSRVISLEVHGQSHPSRELRSRHNAEIEAFPVNDDGSADADGFMTRGESGCRRENKRVRRPRPQNAPKGKESVQTNPKERQHKNPTLQSPPTARATIVVKSTLREMLGKCSQHLQHLHACQLISKESTVNPSRFQRHVDDIGKFFKQMISSRGSHGESKQFERILYIRGSPGVGKTTAVNWCCDEAEEAVRRGEFGGGNNILIGRVKTVVTTDPTAILNEIAVALGMGSNIMTTKNHKATIKKFTKNKDLVILVLDEVDNMISGQGGRESGSEKILQSLCDLALDSASNFSLVGISNVIGNKVGRKLQEKGLGSVSSDSFPSHMT